MPEAGHQARRGLSDGPRDLDAVASRSPAGELVEQVDPDGRPIGVITRAVMRATNARHRACYIVVLDRSHGVLVHQRAPWKDIWPSHWDLAFGGVCEPGEPWLDAARRELAEEAGIVVEPSAFVDLGPVRFESTDTRVVGQVFVVMSAGPFSFPDGEVVAHRWVPVDALDAWAARTAVCADSAAVVLPLVAPFARGAHAAPGSARDPG